MNWHANTCAVEEINAQGIDIMDEHGEHIAIAYGSAQGKLIAAAPDLLANLTGLLGWIAAAKKQPRERDHMPDDSYLASAYAAIARATSEQ